MTTTAIIAATLGATLALLANTLVELVKDWLIERRTRREEHRRFQRETLLELQEAVGAVYRLMGHEIAARAGTVPAEGIPSEVDAGDVAVRVVQLGAHIQTDQLQEPIAELWNLYLEWRNDPDTKPLPDEKRVGELLYEINRRIGELLRQTT